MNKKLTEQIVCHVLSNLGLIPATFIDLNKTQSMLDKDFLLNEKMYFQTEDSKDYSKNLYGCQLSVADHKDFKLLLVDMSEIKENNEYCLLIHLTGSPSYGLYLYVGNEIDSNPMIAVSLDQINWMPCNTYLQATFLAAMEQIKDLGKGWSKCSSYKEEYDALQSFIKFNSIIDEGNNEG